MGNSVTVIVTGTAEMQGIKVEIDAFYPDGSSNHAFSDGKNIYFFIT